MNEVVRKLEALDERKTHVVIFTDGDELELTQIEGVDESIYDRDDLMVALVVSQMRCDKEHDKPGTLIQFSAMEVVKVNGVSVEEL